MHLLKGFEVEVFTGTPQGEPLPLAPWLAAQQPGLALEPDARSIEYITPPLASYRDLLTALVEPRLRLRRLLATRGATLIPGSTLPLQGAARSFVRSDPSSAYHARIASTYGSRVVTASVHINFGLSCASHIIRACRMLRMDAAVVLALTASSPFYEGHASGYH